MTKSVLGRMAATVIVCLAGILSLAVASPASTTAAPVVSVTSPSYDAPGGTAMTVITVANVPVGYTATMTARVGAWPTSCDPFRWKHGLAAVSQKCYANLPNRVGTWTLRGAATLTKAGSPTRVYTASKIIKTEGTVTRPVSAANRALISKCYNTTKNVWLTFDDGYTSQANLNSILYTLKVNNVRGRFFLVGSWARSHSAMVKQIKEAGHYVGNHTNTHPALNQVSDATVRSQVTYGEPATTSPKLLRPPYGAGAYTTRLYYLGQTQGYRLCHWGADSSDWQGISTTVIVNKLVKGDAYTAPVRAGDSVLMHLTNTNARYALPTVIKSLRAKGLVFDRLR